MFSARPNTPRRASQGRSGGRRVISGPSSPIFAISSRAIIVVHVDHGIGRFEGLQTISTAAVHARVHAAHLRRQCEAIRAGRANGSRLAIFVGRGDRTDARPTWRHRLAKNKGEGQACDARHGGRAFAALCRAQACSRPRLLARRSVAARIRGRVSIRADGRSGNRDRGRQRATWKRQRRWTG